MEKISDMRKKMVAGNWKMNLNYDDALSLVIGLKKNAGNFDAGAEVVIAPPGLYLSEFAKIKGDRIKIAAQNCHFENKGAYTGEISPEMLANLNVDYCLVGHSERRAYFNEGDELLAKKVKALLNNGIKPIFCCGELLEDRKGNRAFDTVFSQLTSGLFDLSGNEISEVVIAYEPVWAIGTGLTATPEQAQEMHAFIRECIRNNYNDKIAKEITILYGGSCNEANAQAIFRNIDVDGGLIGGASLKIDSFLPIINAFKN